MKIGVLGSGHVGGTLGKRWAKSGPEIVFASRDPQSEQMKKLVDGVEGTARAGTVSEAANASDVLLLATPWSAAEAAIRSAGDLSGKILIDAVNPLIVPSLEGLSLGTTTSAGEMVAQWASGAKVVKAFNTVGYYVMAKPEFEAGPVAMFYCGDDAEAKLVVKRLIEDVGFEGLDAGPLTQARVLEPFAMLWISLAVKYGYGPGIAFHFMRR
jgi:predicted dinucleotide-binding enzyme